MQLIAYWVGGSIVAARSPLGAVAIMEQHEPAGRWLVDDAVPLTEAELALQVSPDAPQTVAQALARCQGEPAHAGSRADSLLAQASEGGGRPQLIRWDFPGA